MSVYSTGSLSTRLTNRIIYTLITLLHFSLKPASTTSIHTHFSAIFTTFTLLHPLALTFCPSVSGEHHPPPSTHSFPLSSPLSYIHLLSLHLKFASRSLQTIFSSLPSLRCTPLSRKPSPCQTCILSLHPYPFSSLFSHPLLPHHPPLTSFSPSLTNLHRRYLHHPTFSSHACTNPGP